MGRVFKESNHSLLIEFLFVYSLNAAFISYCISVKPFWLQYVYAVCVTYCLIEKVIFICKSSLISILTLQTFVCVSPLLVSCCDEAPVLKQVIKEFN